MTGVGDRIAELLRIKANRLLDRAEDPREVLDFAYAQQLELLQQVRRALTDVATGLKRSELQADSLRRTDEGLEDQAQQALAAGREELARELLTRRAGVRSRLAYLKEQEPLLEAEGERLRGVLQRLEAQTEAFRIRKETLKAEYTRAEAETRAAEAVSGIGEDLGDIGTAVQRATDRTEQLRSRADALDELVASGALENATGARGPDELRIELERITTDQDVEGELKRMKAKLPASPETEEGREATEASSRHAESGGESSV